MVSPFDYDGILSYSIIFVRDLKWPSVYDLDSTSPFFEKVKFRFAFPKKGRYAVRAINWRLQIPNNIFTLERKQTNNLFFDNCDFPILYRYIYACTCIRIKICLKNTFIILYFFRYLLLRILFHSVPINISENGRNSFFQRYIDLSCFYNFATRVMYIFMRI